MEQPVPDKEKKRLSKRAKAIILTVLVICASVLGVALVHIAALDNSLSPGSVILNQTEVRTIIPGVLGFEMVQLPIGNNLAAMDYTTGNPIPVFGGPVTSPNLAIIILKNKTEQAAITEYKYLQTGLDALINEKITSGNITRFSLINFPYPYFTLYNETQGSGAMIAAEFDYVVILFIFNSNLPFLKEVCYLQTYEINLTFTYDQSHYIL